MGLNLHGAKDVKHVTSIYIYIYRKTFLSHIISFHHVGQPQRAYVSQFGYSFFFNDFSRSPHERTLVEFHAGWYTINTLHQHSQDFSRTISDDALFLSIFVVLRLDFILIISLLKNGHYGSNQSFKPSTL